MNLWARLLGVIRPSGPGAFEQPPPPPIPWQPNALAPVFWGYRDYSARSGVEAAVAGPAQASLPQPPCRCRIYYPSLDGTPEGAPILDCGLYPLILFAHGSCAADVGAAAQYTRWDAVLGQLARCGYVIVVPELAEIETSDADPLRDDAGPWLIGTVIDWMWAGWEYRATLATSAGIAGWSYGGGLAAKFTAAHPWVAAVATLSAPMDSEIWWTTSQAPKLLVWGNRSTDGTSPLADDVWDRLPAPKHRVVFANGTHIDYLPAGVSACDAIYGRGPCSEQPELTAEVLMMFFGRYLTPAGAPDLPARIDPSLVPPDPDTLPLTPEQHLYSGGFLNSFPGIANDPGCQVSLTWDIGPGTSGTITRP